MIAASYASLWPAGFDPESPGTLASSTVVDGLNRDADPEKLHSHVTGQLALCLSGAAGLEMSDGFCAIPPHCAIWLPPHVPHNGVLGIGTRTIYFMVAASICKHLPLKPQRLMLNSMTQAMIEHFTLVYKSADDCVQAARIAAVILGELQLAKTLPIDFSPMPKSSALRRIAMELLTPEGERLSNAQWAQRYAMSERTLSRKVMAETGMSFRAWRQRTLFMAGMGALLGGARVEEIAAQLGYGTPSSFIAAFKTMFGCSPGKYRDEQLSGK